MRQRIVKRGYIAGALVLLLVLSSLYLTQAFAAGAVDTSRTGTLTLTVDQGSEFYQELSGLDLGVKLYRVADITNTGAYTPVAGYEELKIQDIKADGSDSAKLWEEKAQQAAQAVKGKTPDAEVILTNGTTPAKELPLGMYLVMADSSEECHS
ncbi:MAG: hypothetical protein QM793_01645 [Muricomes sp.]